MKENKLGKTLRKLRTEKRLTLVQVEKKIKMSNAYISQIETGRIKRPSPHVLYAFARAYEVDTNLIMKAAGYIKRKDPLPAGTSMGHAFLSAAKLTKREQKLMWELLKFLRGNKVK